MSGQREQVRATRHLWADALLVVLVAGVARLAVAGSLPSVITNDGFDYLGWALNTHGTGILDLPHTRTPGYPALLAAIIGVAGRSADAVTIVNHACGVITALCIWAIARRLTSGRPTSQKPTSQSPTSRRIAIVAGLLAGLDPWLLGFESYVLAGPAATALATLSLMSCVVLRGVPGAIAAGVCIGAAVLVRPSFIAWMPPLLVVASMSSPKMLRNAAAFALACIVALGPWIAFNHSRGVSGIIDADGLSLWGGLARAGLVVPPTHTPREAETEIDQLLAGKTGENIVMGIYRKLGRAESVDRGEFLSDWASQSLRADRAGYASAVLYAACRQTNAIPPGSPFRYDDTQWLMRRLGGEDAVPGYPPNFASHGYPAELSDFASHGPRGPLAATYGRWPFGYLWISPHLIASALTLFAGFACVSRRDTRFLGVVLLSAFPIVIGHAVLLQPFARYSMSAWPVCWLGMVVAVDILCRYARGRFRHPLPE